MVEGNSASRAARFSVSLTFAAATDVTVTYATVEGTATATSDYTHRSGAITIPAGASSASISVSLRGDTTVEPDETFKVVLSNPVGAALARTSGSGRILNDDPSAGLRVAIGNASIREGTSGSPKVRLTVSLSGKSSTEVSALFAVRGGTATEGQDFTAASGFVAIPPGATSSVIAIPVTGDRLPEADEMFSVRLSEPIGAVIGRATGTATILNDDVAIPTPVLGVVAGDVHTCALITGGNVKCWGSGVNGELGANSKTNIGDSVGEMGLSLPPVNLGSGRTAIALSAGATHTCALLDNHTVKCWGASDKGQLGQGTTSSVSQPGDNLRPVSLGTGRTAVQISSGGYDTCALLDNATVKCWGDNSYGALGQGTTTPSVGDSTGEMGDNLRAVDLGTGRTALSVAADDLHACALLDDHSMKCWGLNHAGQLGQGTTETIGDNPSDMGDNLPRIDLGSGRTASEIATGESSACALLDNHTAKCWGSNYGGALGQGTLSNVGDQPGEMGDNLSAINVGTGRSVLRIAPGAYATCALLDNTTVKCWGHNVSGALGLGIGYNPWAGPTQMGDALPAVDLGRGRTARDVVTSNEYHSCVVLDDRSLKCWGYNYAGELGQGTTADIGDQPGEMGDNLAPVLLGGVAP